MKTLSERELRELLTIDDEIEAPAELAERIRAEIPENLTVVETGPAARRKIRRAGRWLALAASIAAMAGGSFLAFRMLRQPEIAPVTVTAPIAEHRAPEVDDRIAEGRIAEGRIADQEAKRRPAERGTIAAAEKNEDVGGGAEPTPRTATESDIRFRGGSPRVEPELSAATGGEALLREALARKVAPRQKAIREAAPREAAPREELVRGPRDAGRYDEPARELGKDLEVVRRELQRQSSADADADHYQVADAAASPPPVPQAPPPAPKRRVVPRRPDLPALAEPPAALAPPSTGGTAEPNDAPYGDVFFRGYGTNPFIDTEDDALSTFGLDVDTGSYTVVRRYLRDGHLPPADAVRVEELVNYFDYGDPPPEEGDFAIHAEGAPAIFARGERYHLVRFNLRGREIDEGDRRPALLTFVVDVSGSMARENRLGLVKDALALLLDQLRRDDRIALVVYGTRGRVVLEPTGDRGAIRRAIDRLVPEGATNAEEGLRLAYDLAARHRRRERSGVPAIHRVILCSDGVANVGKTSAESILGEIRRQANQGIELTTVGFGMGNYNDVLMERLADTGNGRYAYVDSLDEARRIFVEGLTGTLRTIAAEARVQVGWNPETVARYRLLGYENRDIADERFRDDTVDAGEIGAGHTVTALYEIKLHRKLRRRDEIAVIHLRWGSIAAGEMVEIARPVTGGDFAASWEKASPALRLTSLVAEFAEILKGTYWAREGDLEDVFRRAQRVSAEFAGDREVVDFVGLVGRAADHRREE